MKQINIKEINSKNYINKTSNSNLNHQQSNKNNNNNKKNNEGKVYHKRKHQTYDEAFIELNLYIEKVTNFTDLYIARKRREKGFFGRLLSKIRKIEEEEREEWIDEVSNYPDVQFWMDKINNLIEFIYDYYDIDFTDYVSKRLGDLFPEYY